MYGELLYLLSRPWFVVGVLGVFNLLCLTLINFLKQKKKSTLKLAELIIGFGCITLPQILIFYLLFWSLFIGPTNNDIPLIIHFVLLFPLLIIFRTIEMISTSVSGYYDNIAVFNTIFLIGSILSAITAGGIFTSIVFTIKTIIQIKFPQFDLPKLFSFRYVWKLAASGLIGGAILFNLIFILNDYCRQSWFNFHIFNAHLKDVCSEDKWSEQCPRTLSDLRNFDPPHFDEMNKCSRVFYFFDDQGKGLLVVNQGNQVLISDDRMHDRFGYYLLSDPNQNASTMMQSVPSYPPAMESNWPNLSFWEMISL